eukprot:13478451-Alexandrium_andersonii.AAC.1
MRNCVRRSKLELRGPRNDLKIGLQSFRRVCSAPLFAQMPNLPAKQAGWGTKGASRRVWGQSPPGRL